MHGEQFSGAHSDDDDDNLENLGSVLGTFGLYTVSLSPILSSFQYYLNKYCTEKGCFMSRLNSSNDRSKENVSIMQ